MQRLIPCLLISIFALFGTVAQASPAAMLHIKEVYAYPSLGLERPAIAFVSIDNTSATPHTLLKVSADEVCKTAEIHRHSMENGVMQMSKMDMLNISAKTTMRFEDSSLHIMLIDLKKPLKVGDSFPLTLTFNHNIIQTIQVVVRPRA